MVEKTGYSDQVDQIELLLREGPLGVKCKDYSLVKRSWHEKALLIMALALSITTKGQRDELQAVYSLAWVKVQILSAAHQEIKKDSTYLDRYTSAKKTFQLWNSRPPSWQEGLIEGAGISTDLPTIPYSGLTSPR